jgi:trehalose 6-phosphate phosphatase
MMNESARPSGPGLPRPWRQSPETESLWTSIRSVRRSILLLDYDGTLAPFKKDRLEALPYPGVADRLTVLERLPNVRLVLVSGRTAHELQELLSRSLARSETKFEIWGNHGREHLMPDGSYEFMPLSATDRAALEQAKEKISRLGFAGALELKPASLAVHWRGIEPEEQRQIRSNVESLGTAGIGGLELLPFDGGLELRSNEHTKGTAVAQILTEEGRELPPGYLPAAFPPVAFLGDDLTDEDAFAALGEQGLSILVRPEPRESLAKIWIKPPEELLEFLDQWILCSTEGATGAPTSVSGANFTNERGR